MRTRNSPRNQERLWRSLGGKTNPPRKKRDKVAEARILLASPFTCKASRTWATKVLEKEELRLKVKKLLAEEERGENGDDRDDYKEDDDG